jgi:microcystin-dependent protein
MDQFIGEIEIFAFNFAPRGWAQCNGQTLSIQQNQALFALIGTTFGGNGTSTFMLPNLQGMLAMGQGNGSGLSQRTVGQTAGESAHTLTQAETPAHNHTLNAVQNATVGNNVNAPSSTVALSQTSGRASNGSPLTVNLYAQDSSPNQTMGSASIGITGGQPHSNLMPYLGLNFCIALQGIFPTRN